MNNEKNSKQSNWARTTIVIGALRSFAAAEGERRVYAAVAVHHTLRGPLRFTHDLGWAVFDPEKDTKDGVVIPGTIEFRPIHHIPDEDGTSFIDVLQRALTQVQLAKANSTKKVDGTLTHSMSKLARVKVAT